MANKKKVKVLEYILYFIPLYPKYILNTQLNGTTEIQKNIVILTIDSFYNKSFESSCFKNYTCQLDNDEVNNNKNNVKSTINFIDMTIASYVY